MPTPPACRDLEPVFCSVTEAAGVNINHLGDAAAGKWPFHAGVPANAVTLG